MAQIGRVQQLWRFPVKSMAGEVVSEVELTADGVDGDRAYALLDVQTGRVVSAKDVKHFPHLLRCQASFVAPLVPGDPLPPVAIKLPDGSDVRSDGADVDRRLSVAMGRDVRLVRQAPADFTVEQHHPDLKGSIDSDDTVKTVATRLGSALFAQLGVPSPVAPGRLVDAFPLSLLSVSTLTRMALLEPESSFERERFRMNVIVETIDPGEVEATWIGHGLSLGPVACVQVHIPAPRCVMVTRGQDEIGEDLGVLRAFVRHNRLPIPALGTVPCCGLYATVTAPGTLRAGDVVSLN